MTDDLSSPEAALLERVLATTPDAVVAIDDEGRVLRWNDAAEALFGWPAADVLGRPLAGTVVPPELRPAHVSGLARAVRTGESRVAGRPLSLVAVTREGERLPVDVTIHRTEVEGGAVFHAFLRDARPAAGSRLALDRSDSRHARLADAVDEVGHATFTLVEDPDGTLRVPDASPAACALTGLAADALATDAEGFHRSVHVEDRTRLYAAQHDSAQRLATLHWSGRVAVGGQERRLEVRGVPARVGGGTEWEVSLRDVGRPDAEEPPPGLP